MQVMQLGNMHRWVTDKMQMGKDSISDLQHSEEKKDPEIHYR